MLLLNLQLVFQYSETVYATLELILLNFVNSVLVCIITSSVKISATILKLL